jgi:Leucine-rich repeat (LRR) protein
MPGLAHCSGLSQFEKLRRLKLSDNAIRNLVELSVMTELIEVQLDGNNVIDSVPLTSLPRVQRINLADNPALQCKGVAKFSSAIQITLPEHCQS